MGKGRGEEGGEGEGGGGWGRREGGGGEGKDSVQQDGYDSKKRTLQSLLKSLSKQLEDQYAARSFATAYAFDTLLAAWSFSPPLAS